MSKIEAFLDDLNLYVITDNLQNLEEDFRFVDEDLELEDSEGNYYFVNVDVRASFKYNYSDNSYTVLSKEVFVDFDEEYYGTDCDGGELILNLDLDAGEVADAIQERILEYLV